MSEQVVAERELWVCCHVDCLVRLSLESRRGDLADSSRRAELPTTARLEADVRIVAYGGGSREEQ